MDEELRAYLTNMEQRFNARFDTLTERIEATEARLMGRMNDQFEQVLDSLATSRRELSNTKSFMLEDAITLGQRVLQIERRLDRLERGGGPT